MFKVIGFELAKYVKKLLAHYKSLNNAKLDIRTKSDYDLPKKSHIKNAFNPPDNPRPHKKKQGTRTQTVKAK